MGLSGLFGKWIKRKRNGLGKKEGKQSWDKWGRRHCGKFHLAGALTGHLGGQTTSVSAQILRGYSTRGTILRWPIIFLAVEFLDLW